MSNPQNAAFEKRIAVLEAQRDYWKASHELLMAENALDEAHLNDASQADINAAEAEVAFCERAVAAVEARLAMLGARA